MRSHVYLSLALLLLPACPDPEPQSDDEGNATSDSDSTGSDSTDTGPLDSTHGVVKLEVAADDPGNPPFAGTTQIVATVVYTSCLQDFYLLDHPELQQGEPSGDAIFTEWAERLCDAALDKVVACTVTSIEQTLLPDVDVYSLRVTFAISDASTIEDQWLYIGPLPTTETVADACATPPMVEVRANSLIGRDAGESQVWGIKTIPAASQATTDQAAPLRLTVGN